MRTKLHSSRNSFAAEDAASSDVPINGDFSTRVLLPPLLLLLKTRSENFISPYKVLFYVRSENPDLLDV